MAARACLFRGWWAPPVVCVLILGADVVASAADSKAAAVTDEAENYLLTVAALNKVEAAYREIAAVVKADPAVAEQLAALEPEGTPGEPGVPSVDEAVRRMESVPPLAKAAKNAGIPMRELVLFNYTLMGTAIASSLDSAMGGDTELPDSQKSSAYAANRKWFRENEDAVQRYFSVMDELFPDEEPGDEPEDGRMGGETDTSAAEE